jgi:hypothetical protein
MRHLRLAAVAVGDRLHQTGTRPRNSRTRCKHRFARGRSRLPSARLIRLDTLQDNPLPRNACKRRTRTPSGTDLRPATWGLRFDFLSRGPVPETLHGARSMRRDGRCCRKNFPTKKPSSGTGSILCTRPRKPYSRCKRSGR